MTNLRGRSDLAVGEQITRQARVITAQRIEWYDSALRSAARNELTKVGINIHTDPDYAKAQGLAGIVADGMIMTNWCSAMLVEHFGLDYLETGELRTKFIKPVYLEVRLSVHARVRGIETNSDGSVRYDLVVWCEDQNGVKLTDGDAKVTVGRPA